MKSGCSVHMRSFGRLALDVQFHLSRTLAFSMCHRFGRCRSPARIRRQDVELQEDLHFDLIRLIVNVSHSFNLTIKLRHRMKAKKNIARQCNKISV